MIAGFSYTEARKLTPGFILDAFFARRKYDMAVHVNVRI